MPQRCKINDHEIGLESKQVLDLESRIRDFRDLEPSTFVNESPPAAVMHKLHDAKRLIAELHVLTGPPLCNGRSEFR